MSFLIANVVVAVVFGYAAAARGYYTKSRTNDGDCFPLMKAHFNQSDHDMFSPYIHYTIYHTNVPDLRSFTLQFWVKFDTLDQTSTVFTYVRAAYGNTLISVQYVPSSGWNLKILNSQVTIPFRYVSVGTWHHILVYWIGHSSDLTFCLDDKCIPIRLSTKNKVIPGGGIVRSGHSELSIAFWDNEVMQEQPDEGLNGWLTLLNFDSRPFAVQNIHVAKQKVSYLLSTCGSAGNRGNIIDWQSTPLKGYGGVTAHLARDNCASF